MNGEGREWEWAGGDESTAFLSSCLLLLIWLSLK